MDVYTYIFIVITNIYMYKKDNYLEIVLRLLNGEEEENIHPKLLSEDHVKLLKFLFNKSNTIQHI